MVLETLLKSLFNSIELTPWRWRKILYVVTYATEWSGVEYKAVEGSQFARAQTTIFTAEHIRQHSHRGRRCCAHRQGREETERGRGSMLLIYDKHVEEEPICVCAVRIGILMEVSILFSILDGPGRRGRLILFPIELKAADMGISVRYARACL